MQRRLVFLAAAAVAPVWAQTAHIGAVSGNVTVQTGNAPAVAAAPDTLAISGTTIVTAAHSTAMIDFDWSHSVEVGPNAEFRLASLESGRYETEIVRGSLTWWVRGDAPAHVEVKTPSITVAPAQPGTYGIAVTAARESEVTAWEGAVEVRAPAGSEWVYAGQKLIARGSPADPEYRIVGAGGISHREVASLRLHRGPAQVTVQPVERLLLGNVLRQHVPAREDHLALVGIGRAEQPEEGLLRGLNGEEMVV